RLHIWMARLSNNDLAKSLSQRIIFLREELQFVHIFEIEIEAAFRAVNLKSIEVFPAVGKPRRLECPHCAIFKIGHKRSGVVDRNTALRSSSLCGFFAAGFHKTCQLGL